MPDWRLEPNWWRKPLRISQTNLQARDTPKYQPAVFMRQLAEMENNVAIANAGGIYAWYPTQVADHNVNPYLDGRDFVRECVDAAHENGMYFVARVDFSLADDAIFARHPDWFSRDREGSPIIIGEPRPGPWGLLYYTCPNAPYRNEAVAFKVLRELTGRFDLDGLFINAAGFRPCWCGTCQRKYRRDTGAELPLDENWRDANFRRWVEWRYDCLAANFGAMYRAIQDARPGTFWTSEFGAITSSRPWQGGHDLFRLRDECAVITTGSGDPIATGRPPHWLPAIHAKYARALSEPEVPWATVHPTAGLSWRHTGLPLDELRLWLAQVNAHGAYAWHAMTGTPDTHYDRRNLPIHREFNVFVKENEDAFRDTTPAAPVALLWSRSSLERYGGDKPEERWQQEFYGFCESLLGEGIPFTIIPDQFLADEHLARYDVLVLPNVACLTADAAAAIQRFAQSGKGIVASFATGHYDEEARPRGDGALDGVLGAAFTGHVIGEQPASYGRIEQAEHPLFAGIGQTGETQFVPNGLAFCNVDPQEGTEVLLTLVPPFAPMGGVGAPPERASVPTDKTDVPLAVQHGRAIYFANEIGKLAWRYRMPDHSKLIANAVRAVAPQPLLAEILDAPYGVQLSLFRQDNPSRLLCHLVNTCGAGTVRHDAVPVHDIRLLVPPGTRRARALALRQDLPVSGGAVTLPVLNTWEIIAVE
jgi:hypothetical protein